MECIRLTPQEEFDLCFRARHPHLFSPMESLRARDELIARNMPLVYLIAGRFARKNPHVDLDDFIGQGSYGLVKAACSFNFQMGNFGMHASNHIKWAIMAMLDTFGTRSVICQSGAQRKLHLKMLRGRRANPEMSDEEVASKIGLTKKEQDRFRYYELSRAPHEPINIRYCADPRNKAIPDQIILAELREIVGTLPDHEQTLLKLRLESELSFNEIGKVIGLWKSNVNKRYTKIVDRLMERMHA